MNEYERLQQYLTEAVETRDALVRELQSKADVVYASLTNRLGVRDTITTPAGTAEITGMYTQVDGVTKRAASSQELNDVSEHTLRFSFRLIVITEDKRNRVFIDLKLEIKKHSEDDFRVSLQPDRMDFRLPDETGIDSQLKPFVDLAMNRLRDQIQALK